MHNSEEKICHSCNGAKGWWVGCDLITWFVCNVCDGEGTIKIKSFTDRPFYPNTWANEIDLSAD